MIKAIAYHVVDFTALTSLYFMVYTVRNIVLSHNHSLDFCLIQDVHCVIDFTPVAVLQQITGKHPVYCEHPY